MSHIFISYSHDDEDLAFALKGQLVGENLEVFIDDSGLRPGDDWRNKLHNALDHAFAVIVICTQTSMESHEVTFEWSYALGRNIQVIPLIYKSDCKIHSRLETLQHLDFSNPRNRPWHELFAFLKSVGDGDVPSEKFVQEIDLESVFFSRDKLAKKHSIVGILQRTKPNTELLVVARSCEAWARQYTDLQDVLNEKSLSVKLSMVDPSLPKDRWMIKDDWAQMDVNATIEKLQKINLTSESKGLLQLYWLPSSPLFSFVYFIDKNGDKVGVLEIGASLSLSERVVLMFRSGKDSENGVLDRLYKIHSRIFSSSLPAFSIGGNR